MNVQNAAALNAFSERSEHLASPGRRPVTSSVSHQYELSAKGSRAPKRVSFVRFEDFGWCKGNIIDKNTDRRIKFKGQVVNFIAKFEIDEYPTDLVLNAEDYSTSAFAEYGSWALLSQQAMEAEAAEAEA